MSPDHIERHKTLKNYINAKFKLLKSHFKGQLAFVNKDDLLTKKELASKKYSVKIIRVNTKKIDHQLKNLKNKYFLSDANQENLSFVLEISKKFKIKRKLLIKTLEEFNGLKYRQQVILRRKYLTIINDSKSTSFSSSISLLKSNSNIYWLLGGINKKGDKFKLPKKYFKNIKAFVYGKNKSFFNKELKGKIDYKNFHSLKAAFKGISSIIRKKKFVNKTILFSPCAASFDNFKNFEDRGLYFNKLVKVNLNGI